MGLLDTAVYDAASAITPQRLDSWHPKFFLAHGLADDNVHFLNSAQLQAGLIARKKPFTQAFYANKDHSISGVTTRFDLYKRIYAFLIDAMDAKNVAFTL